ncbi:MAG: hypothetical protein AAGJ91_13920 [Pseudomonadota bacterium]
MAIITVSDAWINDKLALDAYIRAATMLMAGKIKVTQNGTAKAKPQSWPSAWTRVPAVLRSLGLQQALAFVLSYGRFAGLSLLSRRSSLSSSFLAEPSSVRREDSGPLSAS